MHVITVRGRSALKNVEQSALMLTREVLHFDKDVTIGAERRQYIDQCGYRLTIRELVVPQLLETGLCNTTSARDCIVVYDCYPIQRGVYVELDTVGSHSRCCAERGQ